MQKLFCSCPVQAAAAEQYLKSRSPQWTDDLHHLRPGSGDAKYVSTGQIRERGEFQDYPGFGAEPPDNGYSHQQALNTTSSSLAKGA